MIFIFSLIVEFFDISKILSLSSSRIFGLKAAKKFNSLIISIVVIISLLILNSILFSTAFKIEKFEKKKITN